MRSTDLEILAILAEELNMRKAAERLYVSQPALSQRLQAIEKVWNETIFLRSRKGLTLTAAGEQIIRFAIESLAREKKVKDQLAMLTNEVSGTLKLAVSTVVGTYWLPPILKQFVQTYPHVQLSLTTGWSREILRCLYEGDFHIGIVRGKIDWAEQKKHLFSDQLYLVDTAITTVDELTCTAKPFIQFKSDSTYDLQIQQWWRQRIDSQPKRMIAVDQIETCKQLVLNGIGYAILPEISLPQEEGIHKIPLYDDHREPLQRDTWLCTDKLSVELKQVKAFIECLEQQ